MKKINFIPISPRFCYIASLAIKVRGMFHLNKTRYLVGLEYVILLILDMVYSCTCLVIQKGCVLQNLSSVYEVGKTRCHFLGTRKDQQEHKLALFVLIHKEIFPMY